MNTVILLAGGVGSRVGADIPKQFVEIRGKPIIVHTILNFQRNPKIDDILVVCESNWIEHMRELAEIFSLDKVRWIIPGGATCHDSTCNGVLFLRDKLCEDDYIIVHDAARPILPQRAIDEMLRMAKDHGNASLAIPCNETVILTEDGNSGIEQIDRARLSRVQTPQAYQYGMILSLYEKAEEENRHDFVYADLVLIYYGYRVYFSKGFTNNIKITRREDIALCDALMNFSEDDLFSM